MISFFFLVAGLYAVIAYNIPPLKVSWGIQSYAAEVMNQRRGKKKAR